MAAGGDTVSRRIVKAMSVFGGVQVVTILCGIIRTKLVAVWIGPAGIGLFGLYNAAVDMINSIANLGIRSSSVRDISIETERGNRQNIAEIISVVKRWTWVLGMGAAFFTLVASPLLSRWTFGDTEHSLGFVVLSVTVMFSAVTNCEQSILQGTRRLRRLAKIGVCGAVSGLVVSVPLFYFLREHSIVPSIVAYSAAVAFFSWKFRNDEYRDVKVSLSYRDVAVRGAGFVKLGFFMTLGTFLSLLSSYIFIAYLNHAAGTGMVGYYQAGHTLVCRYSALIFTSIGTEYYPRLARVCHSRMRTGLYVSQEINIALTVLVPVISLFLLFRELVVSLLYSSDFHVILPFISIAGIGVIFQGISWCMAFVIIAKGKGKTYIVTECMSTVLGLILNIVFYNRAGLVGLGWAYVVWYISYTVIVGVVYFRNFGLTMHTTTLWVSVYALLATVAVLLAVHHGLCWVAVIVSVMVVAIAVVSLRRQLAIKKKS